MNKQAKIALWIVGSVFGVFVGIPIIIGIIMAVVPSSPITHKPIPSHHIAQAVESKVRPAEHQKVVTKRASPTQHAARIASYAIDDEAGDPPGTHSKLEQAANLAARGSNCAEVIDAAYVPPADRFPGHKDEPYFVQCSKRYSQVKGAAYGVYFTEADLRAHHVKGQQQPIGKDRVIELCEAAIKGKLKYPSSFDLKVFSGGGVSDNGTTNREVDLPFTALNGLGNRIPQMGKCIVGPDGRTDVTILNR